MRKPRKSTDFVTASLVLLGFCSAPIFSQTILWPKNYMVSRKMINFEKLYASMKRLLIIMVAIAAFFSLSAARHTLQSVPNVQLSDARRFVSNPDGVLDAQCVAALDEACDSLRSQGLAQIAIVALQDIDSSDVFDFGHKLFSQWGVGGSSSNNGLGILLVVEQGEIRFFTGDGLEGILPDAMCRRIQMQKMVPAFREGDFGAGMIRGMETLAQILSSDPDVSLDEDTEDEDAFVAVALFICLMVLLLIFWLVAKAINRCPKCRKGKLKRVSSELISSHFGVKTYLVTYECDRCGHTLKRKQRDEEDNWSGGGHGGTMFMGGSGGSSFSGGGSWGGGHFGGGGAGSRF